MGTTKYNIGDKVKVVNYGNLCWHRREDGKVTILDTCPEVIGQEGIVDQAKIIQGKATYAIDGIKYKHAWYDDGQLEMVNKNPNN